MSIPCDSATAQRRGTVLTARKEIGHHILMTIIRHTSIYTVTDAFQPGRVVNAATTHALYLPTLLGVLKERFWPTMTSPPHTKGPGRLDGNAGTTRLPRQRIMKPFASL